MGSWWYEVWAAFCGLGLESKQEAVGYSHGIHAAITPLGISCPASYCSMQGSQLGKTGDCFPRPVSGIVPSTLPFNMYLRCSLQSISQLGKFYLALLLASVFCSVCSCSSISASQMFLSVASCSRCGHSSVQFPGRENWKVLPLLLIPAHGRSFWL